MASNMAVTWVSVCLVGVGRIPQRISLGNTGALAEALELRITESYPGQERQEVSSLGSSTCKGPGVGDRCYRN